jgi:hypothetical protein
MDEAKGMAMLRDLVAELNATRSEGQPFTRTVYRMVGLEPILNAAANGDVNGARCVAGGVVAASSQQV